MTFLIVLYPLSWRVTYLDVGQGDATLIQSPLNSYTILIDTGQASAFYQLNKSLERYGVDRINTLIITHDDADHVGNIDKLLAITDRVVRDKGVAVPFLQSYLDDFSYHDINENSLIYSFRTRRTRFLFMGDAGRIAEIDFIRENPFLKVDVLKLGHHGSRTSTSEGLLATLKARYAIISSKPSTYGHPHLEVMRSLNRFRVKPLLTADSGNIRIISGILFDYVLTDAFGFGIIR